MIEDTMTIDDGPVMGCGVGLEIDLKDPPSQIHTSIGWIESKMLTDEQALIVGEALRRQFIQYVRIERAKAGIDAERAAAQKQRDRDLARAYGLPAEAPPLAVAAE